MNAPTSALVAVLAAPCLGLHALALLERQAVRRRLASVDAGASTWPSPLRAPTRLAEALDRAGRTEDPDTVFACWLAIAAGLAVIATVLPAARIVLVLLVAGPPLALVARRDHASRRRRRQLPHALTSIASNLRAGHSLATSIAHAGALDAPLGPELDAIRRMQEGGRRLVDGIEDWRDANDDAETAIAAAALGTAATVGGPGARALDAAARSLRDRSALEAEVAGLATQARLSALVLTLAPVAFSVVVVSVDPASAQFMLGSPLGLACVTAGLTLDAAGAWWMQRLVARSAR